MKKNHQQVEKSDHFHHQLKKIKRWGEGETKSGVIRSPFYRPERNDIPTLEDWIIKKKKNVQPVPKMFHRQYHHHHY